MEVGDYGAVVVWAVVVEWSHAIRVNNLRSVFENGLVLVDITRNEFSLIDDDCVLVYARSRNEFEILDSIKFGSGELSGESVLQRVGTI